MHVFVELITSPSPSSLGEFFMVDFQDKVIYLHCRNQSAIQGEQWARTFAQNHAGYFLQDKYARPGAFTFVRFRYPGGPVEAGLSMVWYFRALFYGLEFTPCPNYEKFAQLLQEVILLQRLI